jgi:chromosome segregation ATPase
MGTTNEKADARTEEEKLELNIVPRRSGIARSEGENAGNQQERDHRANSTRSSIFSPGTAVTGGMLDHLIDEYRDQMATKESELERLKDEIKRLAARIKEFEALRQELKKQSEENS